MNEPRYYWADYSPAFGFGVGVQARQQPARDEQPHSLLPPIIKLITPICPERLQVKTIAIGSTSERACSFYCEWAPAPRLIKGLFFGVEHTPDGPFTMVFQPSPQSQQAAFRLVVFDMEQLPAMPGGWSLIEQVFASLPRDINQSGSSGALPAQAA